MLMTSPLKSVRAIVRTLRTHRRSGQQIEAVVLCPELYRDLQARALQYLWSDPGRRVMLEVPVEIDPNITGWTLRLARRSP